MSDFIFHLKILGEEDLHKLFSKWLVQYGTKSRFTSFCCEDLYVTFEYCSFMFCACFLLINYICSVKVRNMYGSHTIRHTRTADVLYLCIRMMYVYYWCDITQLIVEPDWWEFIWSTDTLEAHDKAVTFMYSDFCTSVTKKNEPTGHTENATDYGKYKLSDS
jgi:hypothetical protein